MCSEVALKSSGIPARKGRHTNHISSILFETKKVDILAGQNPDDIILLIALYADGTMIKVWVCFLK